MKSRDKKRHANCDHRLADQAKSPTIGERGLAWPRKDDEGAALLDGQLAVHGVWIQGGHTCEGEKEGEKDQIVIIWNAAASMMVGDR